MGRAMMPYTGRMPCRSAVALKQKEKQQLV
jgi:hypothetical protein